MGHEYFAVKLMSGNAHAPKRMRWWVDHSSLCHSHLLSVMNSDMRSIHDLKTRSVDCGIEWDALIHSGTLMSEHVGLEIAMIEAERVGDVKNLLAIPEFMMENVYKQVERMKKIRDFPVITCKGLLLEHVKLFIEMIRWQKAREPRKLSGCHDRWNANALALSAFSAEWF